jgi:hypothetical protein
MMMRSSNNILSSVFCLLAVIGAAAIANAQQHRAPRIAHPDLMPAEKATDVSKQLEPTYDRAKDETTYFLSGVLVVAEAAGREVQVPGEQQRRFVPSAVMKMVVYYKSPGKTRTKPERVVIALNSGNAFGFEFSQHRDLSIELPDEKIQLGRMSLTAKKDEGHRPWGFLRYWETLELPIAVETYKKILAAKSVNLKIGGGAATLTSSQLKLLRKYAKDLDQFFEGE